VSEVSEEDATRMLATLYPQRVVRVGLVEFGEQHYKQTNEQHKACTAADRRPTNQLRGRSKLNREVARHVRYLRSIFVISYEDVGHVDEDMTRML